ncbi:pyruvate dehydrogenase subunit beta [Sphingobium jiangsuense]|uniref:Pyruvate dehydrogenase E1 component beta subunit n=1 Tax=Sphingobium jiangsuense TaxID=870476 RepID=A0A7W6BH25_9SPHN|nr:pyruvate dehydrogenase complex E1 component subunit beta [Sphingobium jiangsuense]MBB3926855.1 pyruvate dehydrogenase E1 component beta subunit [Sphingobium jiangsuense]GLS98863.1 pyruvate dehydrogenase subunit beta [Sphingobium jiangsuense]
MNEIRNDTQRLSYLQAIIEAQREEMRRDPNVILMGEDIAVYGAQSLFEEFDASRLRNTPISENSFVGVGIGAALTGLRPIVDLTIASFCYLASDQLLNQAAKLRFMTGGQLRVPFVMRTSTFYNNRTAAQHADRPYPLFINTPGVKVIAPSCASDMKGLLKSAIRDDDPVVVFEDINLWGKKEEVPTDPDFLIPIGEAAIRRSGKDVTIVAFGGTVSHALAAAEALAVDGIEAEVIDLRTIAPMDRDAILTSVAKTGRLVIADNSHNVGSVASEIAAVVVEEGFESLRRPILRVTAPQVHIPYNGTLEKQLFVSKDRIVEAVRMLV